MCPDTTAPQYSFGENLANSITHGLGILLSIGGLSVLTAFASHYGGARHITACSIFGATLIILYTASTLYHSIQAPRARLVLRTLDHSAIFLLIAGTYTPLTLISLHGPWGWSLFGVIWGLAVLGILIETSVLRKLSRLTLALYVAMGWVVVVAFKPMLASLAPGGLILLVLGGLAYTLGVPFYVWKRLPFNHAVWHLFVLAGSILHFFAILLYVLPVWQG